MSECTLLGKSGILSASVESSVRSSISSSASMICVSAVDASVGTLLVAIVEVVAVVVVVVSNFWVGDLYEAVDTFSINTGSCELSLSSSLLSWSSEHTEHFFVPPFNKP